MPQQILVIHGGDAFVSDDAFLTHLQNHPVELEKYDGPGWKNALQERLGSDFDVFLATMPNKQNAKYEHWKITFTKLLSQLNNDVILIGHSLGAIFLAKYLSEESIPITIRSTMLVAAPFSSTCNDYCGDFFLPPSLQKLSDQCGALFLYHSDDDHVVPFDEIHKYAELLPNAILRPLHNLGHVNGNTFAELESDILALTRE